MIHANYKQFQRIFLIKIRNVPASKTEQKYPYYRSNSTWKYQTYLKTIIRTVECFKGMYDSSTYALSFSKFWHLLTEIVAPYLRDIQNS